MPKFVLIDPSLQAVGGHHFEYALHVLRAAEQAGFEPWLATHRKFHEHERLPEHWRVIPLYQRGIYTKRRILPDSELSSAAPLHRRWAVRLLSAWWNERRRQRRSTAFARDTANLFQQLTLEPGDQVFLPTVSELELFGLGQFLAQQEHSCAADWHLQFHFPIYYGYEPDYPIQDAKLEGLRRGFRKALALAAEHRLHFYTTTEALAVQHNRLGVAQFQALPYPANPALQNSRSRTTPAASPRRVAFLGDARYEKGYQLLPHIIDALSSDYIANNRIHLVIQSDFTVPRTPQESDTSILKSKDVLSKLPSEQVTLLNDRLDSAAFTLQTLQCDVGLLPYERTAYCVRCSGVLVDLLSIGVPVVVPAGTWLADQLAEPTREYHISLRHGPNASGRTTARPGKRLAVPERASDLLLFLRWPVDLKLCSGAYASVVTSCWGSSGERLETWPTIVGPGKPDRLSTALVRLPAGTTEVSINWRNAFGEQSMDFREVEICFLSASERQTPRGAVGLVAADAQQYPVMLAEIVEHYAHYRQTAIGLSRRWIEWHNPNRIVAELLSQRPSIPLAGSGYPTRPTDSPRRLRYRASS